MKEKADALASAFFVAMPSGGGRMRGEGEVEGLWLRVKG